jgi:predicted Zn-dependent protease
MEQRRSRSSAEAEPPRARVLPFWAVLGIALMVSAVLALLFPRQTLIEQLRGTASDDPLTENYLSSLLRTEPHNYELRVLLAEKRFALGDMRGARAVLEPALGAEDDEVRKRALLLDYRLLSASGTPTDAELEDPRKLASLRARLASLAVETWGVDDILFLSGQARRLGMPAVAGRLAGRLLSGDVHASTAQLRKAAQSALGSGDYVLAANFYFAAQKGARDKDEERELFLRGVSTLQSGNLLREALTAADEHIGDLADDEQTLTQLTRLALAANEPARAQVYVKKLMHMSAGDSSQEHASAGSYLLSYRIALSPSPLPQGEGLARFVDALLGIFVSEARAEEKAAQPASPIGRPYDEELYTLAYNVFLANGNVNDARKVAEAAVAQRPDDMAWREKLAHAAEWSGQAQAALAQWLAIANKTGREDAYQALLRIAPGVRDDEALLAAWRHEAERRPLSAAEWRGVASLYEDLGQPDEGVRYLEQQFRLRADPAILDILAGLQERAGRSDDAIASLERLAALKGPDPDLAVRLATLLFLRSDFSRAYQVLEPLQGRVPPENAIYWKLLADLAYQLQQDAAATTAYGALNQGGNAQESDLVRLIGLLRPSRPEEAERIGLLAWRRFHSVAGMLAALEIANGRHDYARMGQLLAEIKPGEEAGLAARPYYFSLRAAYAQGAGKPREALAEYHRALALTPDNTELRVGLLWLLMDARSLPGSPDELRRRLAQWRGEAATMPAYWDAYAAGYQTLGEARRALPFLSRQAATRASDYIWLANYADALEEAGDAGMAWRVRRQAWLLAKQRVQQDPGLLTGASGDAALDTNRAREAMLAYARLATASAPGDTALVAMRQLLRQDNVAGGPDAGSNGARSEAAQPQAARRLDAAATELVLSWYLSEERYDAAHAWMWARYARRTAAPAWADYSVALAEQDWERLAQLLDTAPPGALALARIEAARATGQLGRAQTLGADALEHDPDNDELHLRLATDLLASATSVIARDMAFDYDLVRGHTQGVRAQVWATPRLRVAVDLLWTFQHGTDETQLTGVPGTDRTQRVSALLRQGVEAGDGETEISLGQRSALADFTTASLRIARPLGTRLAGNLKLTLHDPATDSTTLLVAGHKDEARAELQYGLAAREYFNAQLWSAHFHTQGDSYLGSGHGTYLEAGYRVRSEYPDFNLRLSHTASHYDAVASADAASAVLTPDGSVPAGSFFMPQSFRLWGFNVGLGGDTPEQRSRGLRPFVDLGRSSNSASGSGYNWLLGAGGSVVGPDHASLYWLRSKGGAGTHAEAHEMGLRYEYFFD